MSIGVQTVGAEELRSWRKRLPRGWRRAVSKPLVLSQPSAPVERTGPDGAVLETPKPKPLTPAQTYDAVLTHVLLNAKKSREDFQAMIRQLRTWNPTLIAHLTDEQAAAMLETEWKRKVQEAVARVYHKQGRGRELQIRIGGG
jgi:hypothetical protein